MIIQLLTIALYKIVWKIMPWSAFNLQDPGKRTWSWLFSSLRPSGKFPLPGCGPEDNFRIPELCTFDNSECLEYNGDNVFMSCTSDVAVVCVVGVLSRISSGVIVPPQESSFTVENKGFQNKMGRGMSPGSGPCWGPPTAWLLGPRSHPYVGKARFVG